MSFFYRHNKDHEHTKKHHFFPKPIGYRGGGFLYSFLPFMWFTHPIGRRDQEDQILQEIDQKHRQREQKHQLKKMNK